MIPRFAMTRKILYFSPSWLGDAVMAEPTLAALHEAFPRAEIAVLARRSVAGLYGGGGRSEHVIRYDRQDGLARPLGYVDLIRRLRAFGADVALVLPRSFGAAWTALLSDAPQRVGFRASGRNLLLTDPLPRDPRLLSAHRVHYFQHLLTGLGLAPPAPRAPRLAVADADRERAEALLGGLARRPAAELVALVPGAQYGSAKQWPEERFAELAKKLQSRRDVGVVLLGGPGDRDVADRIRHEIGGDAVLDLTGRTSIPELAALLARCAIAISNDTGAMHVAAAVGTPVVAIFGSTDPVTTSPYGENHVIVREEVECAPCLLRTCPIDHRCMVRIGVDRVLAAAESLLDAGENAETIAGRNGSR
jgi:heptosyltransferase-2